MLIHLFAVFLTLKMSWKGDDASAKAKPDFRLTSILSSVKEVASNEDT